MKTIFTITLLAAGILTGLSQGTVFFANSSSTSVTNALTMARVPAGTTFLAALYYAPDGTPDDTSMIPLGASAGFPVPGIYVGGIRTTPATTAPGGFGLFQVRVWESAFGTSYEEAANAGPMGGRIALTGRSACLRVETGDPISMPPTAPGRLTAAGLTAIVVPDFFGPLACPIPEPNLWLLVAAGLAALGLGHYILSDPPEGLTTSSRSSTRVWLRAGAR